MLLKISELALKMSNFNEIKKDYEKKEKEYKDYDTWLTEEQEVDIAESMMDMFDNDNNE